MAPLLAEVLGVELVEAGVDAGAEAEEPLPEEPLPEEPLPEGPLSEAVLVEEVSEEVEEPESPEAGPGFTAAALLARLSVA